MTGIQTNERDQRPGPQDSAERQPAVQGGASGTGAASAFARMKFQLDHQARQRPAEDSHADEHRGPAR